MFDTYPCILVPITPGYIIVYIVAAVVYGYLSWLFLRTLDK
jgi:hypothetical protein